MDNLEDVIISAVEDAATEPEPIESTDDLDTSADTSDTSTDVSTDAAETSIEVASPASKTTPETKPDEFETKYGIPQMSSPGRENRIPYSRVKKIVAKQAKELEATWAPVRTEFETKVKGYEARLGDVAKFEQIMANEPEKFVQMLRTLPAYQDYFAKLQAQAAPAAEATPVDPNADMPQPDQQLSDGSAVYSMEGLKALNAWNRAQARKDVLEEVNKTYGPIQEQWQAQQRIQQAIPKIQAQIAEARKWPMFNENETEIAAALNSDQHMTLERAYQQVVYPKLVSNKDQMRAELLKELKKAPTSTSVPVGGGKPAPIKAGPRSIEDIIRGEADKLRGV